MHYQLSIIPILSRLSQNISYIASSEHYKKLEPFEPEYIYIYIVYNKPETPNTKEPELRVFGLKNFRALASGSKFTRRRAREREKESLGVFGFRGSRLFLWFRAQGFRECLGFGVRGSFCGSGLKVLGLYGFWALRVFSGEGERCNCETAFCSGASESSPPLSRAR